MKSNQEEQKPRKNNPLLQRNKESGPEDKRSLIAKDIMKRQKDPRVTMKVTKESKDRFDALKQAKKFKTFEDLTVDILDEYERSLTAQERAFFKQLLSHNQNDN